MSFNFTLNGLASVVNFGKGNATIVGASSTQLRARDAGNAADVNMSGADPVASNDFATKNYVDNIAVGGLSWKQYVRVATTSPGTLATDFENGDTVDGVVLATGDRILIKNQASAIENGIYIVQASGAPVRASDMAAGSDAVNAAMFVSEGTANADTAWVETAEPAVVGTNGLTFTNFAVTTGTVTSIANAAGITGTSIIESGAAPVPTLYAILGQSGVLSTALVSSDVVVSVVAGGIGTTQLAADGVTEPKFAPGVAVLYRWVQITFSDFPATPGNTTVNVGSALPTNAIVRGGEVLVTTAFDSDPDLDVGGAASNDLFDASEVDLNTADTYVSSHASLQSGLQLVATLTTNTSQPTTGSAEIIAGFIRPT